MKFRILIKGLKKDLSKFIIYSSGTLISSLISFWTVRVINLKLPSIELGKFTYFQSILQMLFIVLSLNLYNSYLRFNTKGIVKKLESFISYFNIIMMIIFSLIIYIITNNWATAFFSFILIYYDRMYFYRSISDYKSLNFIIVIASLITCIGCYFYFYIFNGLDPTFVLFFYGVGYFSAVFFYKRNYLFNINEFFPFSKKEILKFSVPLIGLTLTDIAYNFANQFFIKHYQGYEEIANYAIAFKCLFFIRFITSFLLLFFPVIYYREIEKGNMYIINKYRNLIVLFLFFAVLVMLYFSKIIYVIMGGEAYLENIKLFNILLIADFFRICTSFFSLIFTFLIKSYISLIIQFVGLVLNVILCIVFIPIYGTIGACISVLMSIGVVFLFNIFYSKKVEKDYIGKLSL